MSKIILSTGDEIENWFHDARFVGANYSPLEYHNQPAKRGDKDFVVSRGMLMEVLANAHKWRSGFVRKESKALQVGSVMDCMTLPPPGGFESVYIVRPATYYNEKEGKDKPWNANATVCKQWKEEHENDLVCTAEDAANARAALIVLMRDPLAAELLNISQKQVRVDATYHDHDTGLDILVKTLIDLVPDKAHEFFGECLADFKSCQSIANGKWAFHVDDFCYDAQAAMELDIWAALHPEECRTAFLHLCQETDKKCEKPTYEVGRKWLDSAFIECGRDKYLAALKKYARCLAENNWPAPDDISDANIRGWTVIKPTPAMIDRAKQSVPQVQEPPPEPQDETDIPH